MADLNIDAVDATPGDEFLTYYQRMLPNALRVRSAEDMTTRILARLGFRQSQAMNVSGARPRPQNLIRRLRIIGHGSVGMQVVGGGQEPRPEQQILNHCKVPGGIIVCLTDVSALQPLCEHFAPDGWVEMLGCYVAYGFEGEGLLRNLATLWRVPVKASTGFEYPGRGFESTVRIAYPDGGMVERPPTRSTGGDRQ